MRQKRTTSETMRRAAELRRNLTPAESKLWAFLRAHRLEGTGFRRQHTIGRFIVDFCAPRQKLVIEIDGAYHLDQVEYDSQRSTYLQGRGYRVLHFFNHQVMNQVEEVLRAIAEALEDIDH